ncbi:MAG TPA: hypothetical protein VMU14_16935, partial [Acidimicrobiales bacterium]|nr:hypothetical protein [Acidimicrobiales bacterium]
RTALQLAEPVANSTDQQRAALAAYLAGRAAEQLDVPSDAASWYARSTDPGAGPARERILVALGRTDAAVALLDTLWGAPFVETDWSDMLGALARAVGADSTTHVLTRLLARRRPSAGARARLQLADGDRLLAAGDVAGATTRYAAARALVPDSVVGQQAVVRTLRVQVAAAESLGAMRAIESRLRTLVQSGAIGGAGADAHALTSVLQRIDSAGEGGDAALFQAAELARDSLSAPRLAASLFLDFARRRAGSLFAPKAIVAAAALMPAKRDSLLGVLPARYAGSPYTLALQGEVSPAYAAAEDSLARALGVAVGLPGVIASRVAAPVPGPRGPPLDEVGQGREGAAPPKRGQPLIREDDRRPTLRPGDRP